MIPPIILPGRTGPSDAVIAVPGSKSIANRALVCAFLAKGTSRVHGVPHGDDCARMIEALSAAGAAEDLGGGSWSVVGGSADRLSPEIRCGLAGTTSRFLTAVAATSTRAHVIDGDGPLRDRPREDLYSALRSLGGDVVELDRAGHLPVRSGGRPIRGGALHVPGSISSQFISALMLIGPILEGGIAIASSGRLVSSSYVEMTREVMTRFGSEVQVTGPSHGWTVQGSGYEGADFAVDADHSSAAFPIVAVLLGSGCVSIPDLHRGGGQGDERMLDIAEEMGGRVESKGRLTVISHDGAPLNPVNLDMSDCSDLVPAVAVACLGAAGNSRLRGVGFIRSKESNRIEGLAGELRRLGADVRPVPDGLDITGGRRLEPTVLSTLHDHRLAMAFAVLSSLCPGIGIENPEVVSKSWPGFFSDMEPLLGPFRAAE